ncbi:hypothetical protein IWW38_003867 [Coemansia aciculifera]|uniref:Uncharacterized protein n=1 Tax=Coemansia aciculifera TaxID=417176 RepID=A0ACC1M098_9FUNG|nr:hypothetical protein IWW38_003867 [Coemansia aciculifera]
MATTVSDGNSSVWTPEVELALFLAMVGLRPVGIHRHFRLVNIYTRLLGRVEGTSLSMDDLKHRLDQLYNINMLDEIEEEEDDDKTSQESDSKSNHADSASGEDQSILPGHTAPGLALHGIPTTSSGSVIDVSDPQFWKKSGAEFALPWAEFGTLMVERAGADEREDIEASASLSAASTPKEVTREATPEPTPEPASSDGRVSPVQKKRRGRSSTPVPRSRTKVLATTPTSAAPPAVTRSAAPSTRKRPKKN